MIHAWKAPHIARGMLTYVPAINQWRARRGATGGSDSARYCYSVWLRHLVTLSQFGFDVRDATVAELGPGDSIGIGLAALLAGAGRYVGVDVVPYAAKSDHTGLISELAQLYASHAAIPDAVEFPRVRPRLRDYSFPHTLVDTATIHERTERLVTAAKAGRLNGGGIISYHAPMTSADVIAPGSLNLVMSQAVLQYVDDLASTYKAMFTWLRPGGFCSHAIGLSANNFSPFWNGHWAFTDLQWQVVRGRREYLLNREPLSSHLKLARDAGFSIIHCDVERDAGGLPVSALAARYRTLASDDLNARGVMLILRKE